MIRYIHRKKYQLFVLHLLSLDFGLLICLATVILNVSKDLDYISRSISASVRSGIVSHAKKDGLNDKDIKPGESACCTCGSNCASAINSLCFFFFLIHLNLKQNIYPAPSLSFFLSLCLSLSALICFCFIAFVYVLLLPDIHIHAIYLMCSVLVFVF